MKSRRLILIFLLLCPFESIARGSINCKVLELIVYDIDAYGKVKIKEATRDFIDSFGRITRITDSVYTEPIPNGKRLTGKIIVVDSFGFFACNNCSSIEVISEIPKNSDRGNKDYYIVTGIATGRKNALAIGISRKGSYSQVVYYISIRGAEAAIIEKYESAIGE